MEIIFLSIYQGIDIDFSVLLFADSLNFVKIFTMNLFTSGIVLGHYFNCLCALQS
jgi:hypothetical protein